MGTGCGILAILMAGNAEEAVAVDINPEAVECARLNARLNSLSDKINVYLGDLFNGVNGKFDLILFNPPYLPTMGEECESELLVKAWNGGPSGRKVIDRFLSDVPSFLEKDGKILMVQSTLSRPEETLRVLENSSFKTRVLAEEELDFEELVVIEAIYEGS